MLPTPALAQDKFEDFRSLLPLTVSQARRGFGGYITFDFGEEQAKDAITNEAQYDWHLWIYMCDWELFKGDQRILWTAESDNALAGAVVSQLTGESLLEVEYDEDDDCFLFHFTGGYKLGLNPNFHHYNGADDLFMLFKHGARRCLSYNPEQQFYEAA